MRTAATIKRSASIDLGYGFTKLSLPAAIGSDLPARVLEFPSMAATSDSSYESLAHGGNGFGGVVEIAVDRVRYQVGPGVSECLSSLDSRVTSRHFFKGDLSKAICLGAMAYMMANEPRECDLDLLVVGLPLAIWQDDELRENIRAFADGSHKLPVPGQPVETRTVTIHQVMAVPQTIGSLFSLESKRGNQGLKTSTGDWNLVIDAGYGTLTWIVSEGLCPVLNASGTNMGGAHTMLGRVAQVIAPHLRADPVFLSKLDDVLRELLGPTATADLDAIAANGADRLSSLFRKQVDSAQVADAIRTGVRGALTGLLAEIPDPAVISNIWLIGGGAHFFACELRRALPHSEIHVASNDARYLNLMGLDAMGRRALLAHQ